jgi:2,5-diketo-D-gluconate reductase A
VPCAPTIELANGRSIPAIGLGTWPMDDREVADAVVAATATGYRLIDTAAKYGNERGVGEGIRACGIPREGLFVITKLDGGYQGDDRAIPGLDACLQRLGLDYVDMLLIHWPLPARGLYVDTWRTFIKLLESGKTRAIGTSNFKGSHIDRLIAETGVVPTLNQIELNPNVPRGEQRMYDRNHGILTQSWSPLGRGSLVTDPTVTAIAAKYGRTTGQIILRWHMELGVSAVVKSANPTRLAENISVFDFTLSEEDRATISRLDQGERTAQDSDVEGH